MNLIIKKVAASTISILITLVLYAQPKITKIEYYIDKDPGFNNATQVSFTSSTDIKDQKITIDPTKLTAGVHVVYVRAKDANGKWSLDNKWLFVIQPTSPASTLQIKTVEYYIDKDPGYGKGTPVAINAATSIPNFNVSVNISALTQGGHAFYIRSKDANGEWSLDNVDSFSISTAVNPATIVINSFTSSKVCAGSSFKVGVQANGTYDSANVFKVQLSSKTGDFAGAQTIGSYTSRTSALITCTIPANTVSGNTYKIRVVSSSPAITGKTSDTLITVNSLPSTPTITTAPQNTINLCPKTPVALTSSAASNNLWNTGAVTKSITVDSAAIYYVTVSNISGCKSISDSVHVSYTTCGTPGSPVTKSITTTSAKLTWRRVACAVNYKVAYRIADTGSYTIVSVSDTFHTVSGLKSSTTYQWKVQSVCSVNPPSSSNYTVLVNFKTNAVAFNAADVQANSVEVFDARIVPNPAIGRTSLLINKKYGEKVSVYLSDLGGKVLWKTEDNDNNNIILPVQSVSTGTYIVTIIHGGEKKTLKFIKE